MKHFKLNKIKVAHLKNANAIIGGAGDTQAIPYTNHIKDCESDVCGSVNVLICTNTSIQGNTTSKPNEPHDTIRP